MEEVIKAKAMEPLKKSAEGEKHHEQTEIRRRERVHRY